MGGSRTLGSKVRTLLDLADLIERGVPQAAAARVRERLELTERELAQGLGNRVPLALMRTEAGAPEVEDLLGRIVYGEFS